MRISDRWRFGIPMLIATLVMAVMAVTFSMAMVDDKLSFRFPGSPQVLEECLRLEPLKLRHKPTHFSEANLVRFSSNDDSQPIGTEANSILRCPIQRHINGSVTYDIGFIEFDDNGKLRQQGQKDALTKYISSHPQLNVILFVHGWRNDAEIGSSDVRRLHTLVSLAANYSKQRVLDTETPVPTLAIFVGWRGRAVAEFPLETLANVWALPSFLGRKQTSDAIAVAVGREILNMESLIKGENPPSNRKLLIVGHSLGGNIVIRGLSETLRDRIEKTKAPTVIEGVGDLVVLVNPASEASQITPLQLSIRRYLGLNEAAAKTNSFLQNDECAKANIAPGRTNFSRDECERLGTSTRIGAAQTPILISLTAAKYFSRLLDNDKDNDKDKDKWDGAVGTWLPLLLHLQNPWSSAREKVTSIGNYLPVRESGQGEVFGVSHEIEIDVSQQVGTTYKFAGQAPTSGEPFPLCRPETRYADWLTGAISTATTENSHLKGRGWDTHIHMPNSSGSPRSVDVNIRHGAARHRCAKKFDDRSGGPCLKILEDTGVKVREGIDYSIPGIGEARDPIWNAATHPNTVREHDAYLSHTLWCVINRFVLDRPSAPVTMK